MPHLASGSSSLASMTIFPATGLSLPPRLRRRTSKNPVDEDCERDNDEPLQGIVGAIDVKQHSS
jgi:hypothetical protein